MKRTLLLICLTFFAGAASGAEQLGVLDSVSGTVQLINADGRAVHAFRGSRLYDDQMLEVSPGAGIVVRCISNSKRMRVATPGRYIVSFLRTVCASSVGNNLHFSDVLKSIITSDRHEEGGQQAGVVYRGGGCAATLSSLDTVCYNNGNFSLSWRDTNGVSARFVNFYSEENGGAPVISVPVKGSGFLLTALDIKQMAGSEYYWAAETVKQPVCGNRQKLVMLARQEYLEILKAVQAEASAISTDTGTKHFLTARLLERRHLMADAMRFFRYAAQERPLFFRKEFERFCRQYHQQ